MQQPMYQHTIAAPFTISGIGLHSGAQANLTVRPSFADCGIVFVRTDITEHDNAIPAKWSNVIDARLCTVISNAAGAKVSTVEHLLSAFAALGVDNAVVEIDGPEVPIMDGSARDFVKALDTVGLKTQSRARRAIVIKKPIVVKDGDKEACLYPADGQFFSFEIAFDSALIGRQKYRHALEETGYRREIASARTFCLMKEVEMMRAAGLIKGGSLDNAVVVDGDKVLNPDGLRFPNEFVRHKILDAIGDLYLAGLPIIGHFHGVKAGHAMNNRLLHALFAEQGACELVELSPAPADMPLDALHTKAELASVSA